MLDTQATDGAGRDRAGLVNWLLSAERDSVGVSGRQRTLRLTLAGAAVALTALGLGAGLLSGCGPSEASASEAAAGEVQPISYTVVNFSDLPIRDVVLYGSGLGKKLGYGQVRAGGRETLTASEGLNIPSEVHLDWTDTAGQRRYTKVALWKTLGPNYTGPVTLTIDDRGQVAVSN